MKLLVVDDDPDLADLLAFAFRREGFLVASAADGEAALAAFDRELPDLVVLDVNLPKLDGFEVCRRLRARSTVPILMLTVRGEEADLVRGLDLGADDYLTKPFSPRTLLARVRALLRRAGLEAGRLDAAGDLALDPEAQTARIAGGPPIRLTRLEYRLLQALLAHAGHTLHAERLVAQVWGDRGGGDRGLLKQLVHRLRHKLEPDPAAPRYLRTVPGVGYRLEPEGTEGGADGEE